MAEKKAQDAKDIAEMSLINHFKKSKRQGHF